MKKKNGTDWVSSSPAPQNNGGTSPRRGQNVPLNRQNNSQSRQNVPQNRQSAPPVQNRRKAEPQAKRPLTPEQLEARRVREEKRKAFIRKRRQIFFARFTLFIAIYLVLCIIIAASLTVLYKSGSKDEKNYRLLLFLDDKKVYSADSGAARSEGGLYIPVTALSELCSLTVAGDSEKVLLFFHDGEQGISLKKDSAVVEINGIPARLKHEVRFGDDIKLPIELIATYINGFEITYDEDSLLCTVSKSSSSSVTLTLNSSEKVEPVSEQN